MLLSPQSFVVVLALICATDANAASLFAATGVDLGNYGFYKSELGTQLVPALAFGGGVEFSSEMNTSTESILQLGGFGFAQKIKLEQVQFGEMQTGNLSAWAVGANLSGGSRWSFGNGFALGGLAHLDYGFAGNMRSSLGVIAFNQNVTRLVRYGLRTELKQDVTSRISIFLTMGYNQGFVETSAKSPTTILGEPLDLKTLEFTGSQMLIGVGYLL
ncbi:MAG: hypothetical protein RL189_779 [Pseudomonadota bacterium]